MSLQRDRARGQRPDWYVLFLYVLFEVGLGAVFPRVLYWLRWPARLGRRGTAIYVVCRTALGMVLGVWAKRMADEQERLRTELTEQLGREPTDEEMSDYRFEELREATGGSQEAEASSS